MRPYVLEFCRQRKTKQIKIMIQEYIRYLRDNPEGYWFKARLYGWGWAPAKKEGWILLLVYLLVIIVPGLFAEKFIQSGE